MVDQQGDHSAQTSSNSGYPLGMSLALCPNTGDALSLRLSRLAESGLADPITNPRYHPITLASPNTVRLGGIKLCSYTECTSAGLRELAIK